MRPEEMLQRFVHLEQRRRVVEDELRAIKEEISTMQEPLQDYFMDRGIQNIRMGDLTVYVRGDFKVAPKNGKDKVIEALQQSGHGEIVNVTYHWKRLCSLVRNYLEAGDELPPELDEAIEYRDEYTIRTRRAG